MHRIWLVTIAILLAATCSACGSSKEPTAESTITATATDMAPAGSPSADAGSDITPQSMTIATNTPTDELVTPTMSLPSATPTATSRPTDVPSPEAIVAADVLNVREGPDTSFSVVKQVTKGTQLDVIGQYGGCSWLKVALSAGVDGWVAGASQYITLGIPCEEIGHGTYRPRTGTVKAPPQDGSLGELEAENGTDLDGVVIVSTTTGEPVAAAYIRAGESFTIRGIPDGTYELYFSTGDDWDGDLQTFTSAVRYQRFDDDFIYATDSESYTIWNVTLHSVTGGTARADSVDPADFPTLQD